MLRTRRGTRSARRAGAGGVAVEPLEGRGLLSAGAVPLAPGSASGPTAALATLTPTFTWSPVAGVSGYQVQVLDRTDGVFAVVVDVGPAATAYTPKPGTLLPGRFFSWSVRDVTGAGVGGAHGHLYFGTPVPPVPVAITAGDAGGDSRPILPTARPTLTWTAAADVSGYVLHVSDETTGAVVSRTVPATATGYTFGAGVLEPGHRFDWNVRDVIGTTTGRAVSNTAHFQLPVLPAPATVGPGTAAAPGPVLTTATPTFAWDPVTSVGGFSGYLFTLVDRTTGASTPVTLAASATSYTLPPGQLAAGHHYRWDVQLVDGTFTGPVARGEFRYFAAAAG